jgi:hypothetical protein
MLAEEKALKLTAKEWIFLLKRIMTVFASVIALALVAPMFIVELPLWCYQAIFYPSSALHALTRLLTIPFSAESLPVFAFSFGLILVLTSINEFFKLRATRKEREQPESIFDEYQPEIVQPIIAPIVAQQPRSLRIYLWTLAGCVSGALFVRLTVWSPAAFHHLPGIDGICTILAVLLGVVGFAVFIRYRPTYRADSQGLEYRVFWRSQHIPWHAIAGIFYLPVISANNSSRKGERYLITTPHASVTLDVPMQQIAQPRDEHERDVLAYPNALRSIAVMASQESGKPIRVRKQQVAQRTKLDLVTSIPLKQRLTQTTPEQLKACAWIMAVSAVVMLPLAPVCAYFWATASVIRYHSLSGYIDSYQSSTAQLTLMGDSRTYTLSIDTSGDNAFHPALPAAIPVGTPVTIWLAGSSSYPDAMQIGTKSTAIKYFDDFYINPVGHYYEDRLGFGILTILCLLLGVPCGVWARGLLRRARAMSRSDLTPVLG